MIKHCSTINKMKQQQKDNDMEMYRTILEKTMKQNYKPRLSSKIGEFFENILLFFIVCLAIIFRPINLIIGGIIAIIILLI